MDRGRRMVDGCGIAGNSRSTRNQMVYPRVYCFRSKTMTMIRWGKLPRAVVKVGVPRGPGAVEGKGELLVVLVLLTPHPKGNEHFVCRYHSPRQTPPHLHRRLLITCASTAYHDPPNTSMRTESQARRADQAKAHKAAQAIERGSCGIPSR